MHVRAAFVSPASSWFCVMIVLPWVGLDLGLVWQIALYTVVDLPVCHNRRANGPFFSIVCLLHLLQASFAQPAEHKDTSSATDDPADEASHLPTTELPRYCSLLVAPRQISVLTSSLVRFHSESDAPQLMYSSFEFDCTESTFGSVKSIAFESTLGNVRHCRARDVKFSVARSRGKNAGIELNAKNKLLERKYAVFSLVGLSLAQFGCAENCANVKLEPAGDNKKVCIAVNSKTGVYSIHCSGRYRISLPCFTKAYHSPYAVTKLDELDKQVVTLWGPSGTNRF
jgi:hypothetical protein